MVMPVVPTPVVAINAPVMSAATVGAAPTVRMVMAPTRTAMHLFDARHAFDRARQDGRTGDRDRLGRAARAAGANQRGRRGQRCYDQFPHGVSPVVMKTSRPHGCSTKWTQPE